MEKFWVKTGARLHLGQLDLNGSLGRLYGGLGLAIDQPQLEITAARSNKFSFLGTDDCEKPRVEKIARTYLEYYALPGVQIELSQALPGHSGLGSGTQLCLALGFAITRVYGLQPPLTELASITDRESSRSGIGVGAFEQGGFLIDGGKPDRLSREGHFKVPPLLARLEFPEEWSIILALPDKEEKMFGSKEESAFCSLPLMSEQVSGSICRLLLMKLLPSLIEKDLQAFGEALTAIQSYLGDYFTPVQGGRYASVLGSKLADFMLSHSAAGVGQSSWGPTVYGFTSQDKQEILAEQTRGFLGAQGRVWTVKGRNQGASWGWK